MDEEVITSFCTNVYVNLKLFSDKLLTGYLCMSKHNIMIMAEFGGTDFYLLLRAIDSVRLTNDYSIELKTKDFKIYTLDLLKRINSELDNLFVCLNRAIDEDKVDELFPFVFKHDFKCFENGWTAFNLKEEFTDVLMSGKWILMRNEICNSYGKMVILPATITQQNIANSAKLHVNNRYPVLSHFHKPSHSVLMRCSQYVAGLEKMGSIDPIIKDLRFQYEYVDLRCKSKGVSLEGNQIKSVNVTLDKIESLPLELLKLVDAIQTGQTSCDSNNSMSQYLNKLVSSQWLDRVRMLLNISREVSRSLVGRRCFNIVLVGDTGHDYELIVSSLIQVIVEPDARTIRGFEALIDREWIQGGHPFLDRCRSLLTGSGLLSRSISSLPGQLLLGNNDSNGNISNASGNESPVFLLFLDCVWQILNFHPTSFEFNESFLLELAHHAYFSEYGTFLGNSEEHRTFYNIPDETTSLWCFLNENSNLPKYLNHLYEPPNSHILSPTNNPCNKQCIPPKFPHQLQIWYNLYSGMDQETAQTHKIELEKTVMNQCQAERNVNIKLRKLLENLEKEVAITNPLPVK